jgi:hypothetical protein
MVIDGIISGRPALIGDLVGCHPRALEDLADDQRAEVGGRGLGQGSGELADGSACRADDDDVFHAVS